MKKFAMRAITALSMLLLLCAPAGAAQSTWTAAGGLLPDAIASPYAIIDTADPEDPTLGGGALTLSTSDDVEVMYYIQSDTMIDIPDPWVIEFEMRHLSGSSSVSHRAPVQMFVTTSPSVGMLFQVGADSVFLMDAPVTVGQTATVDTDDAFHTYRMEVHGNGAVDVYYDAVLTLQGATFTSASNHGSVQRVAFGQGSLGSNGVSEWLSFTHNGLATSTTTTFSTSTTTLASTTSTTTSTSTSSSTTLASTTTTTTTTSTSSTTTTLVDTAVFPPAKKLLVKQKKSGTQRLQLIVKDPAVAAASPCEVAGELVIEAVGVGAPVARFPLDAALWKPIKAKKPEKGCKYRKGPVVATVLIKTGKMLKIVASASDLGIPLGTDPRPVRIELRHGEVRHCVEFGGQGTHKPDKKLLAKKAGPATGCPTSGSPSGAFLH